MRRRVSQFDLLELVTSDVNTDLLRDSTTRAGRCAFVRASILHRYAEELNGTASKFDAVRTRHAVSTHL